MRMVTVPAITATAMTETLFSRGPLTTTCPLTTGLDISNRSPTGPWSGTAVVAVLHAGADHSAHDRLPLSSPQSLFRHG